MYSRVPPLLLFTNLRTFKHLSKTNVHWFGDPTINVIAYMK